MTTFYAVCSRMKSNPSMVLRSHYTNLKDAQRNAALLNTEVWDVWIEEENV